MNHPFGGTPIYGNPHMGTTGVSSSKSRAHTSGHSARVKPRLRNFLNKFPSRKDHPIGMIISQLGWLATQYMGKCQIDGNQTTNQS